MDIFFIGNGVYKPTQKWGATPPMFSSTPSTDIYSIVYLYYIRFTCFITINPTFTLGYTKVAMENGQFLDGITDNNCDLPQFIVCLPEGNLDKYTNFALQGPFLLVKRGLTQHAGVNALTPTITLLYPHRMISFDFWMKNCII